VGARASQRSHLIPTPHRCLLQEASAAADAARQEALGLRSQLTAAQATIKALQVSHGGRCVWGEGGGGGGGGEGRGGVKVRADTVSTRAMYSWQSSSTSQCVTALASWLASGVCCPTIHPHLRSLSCPYPLPNTQRGKSLECAGCLLLDPCSHALRACWLTCSFSSYLTHSCTRSPTHLLAHSLIYSLTHSFTRSLNQSINRSIDQSIDQSINQSINRSLSGPASVQGC